MSKIRCNFNDYANNFCVASSKVNEGAKAEVNIQVINYSIPCIKYSGKIFGDNNIYYFKTGDNYAYIQSSRTTNYVAGSRTTDGEIMHDMCDISSQANEIMAGLLANPTTLIKQYDFPKDKEKQIYEGCVNEIKKGNDEALRVIQMQGNVISFLCGDPFFDDFMGIFEANNKYYTLCFWRCGQERMARDNYTGNIVDHRMAWFIPIVFILVSNDEPDANKLDDFGEFIFNFQESDQLKDYRIQLNEYVKNQAMQMHYQNQQMIQNAWQQHNAAWAQVERMRDSLSKDLDDFRASNWERMQANDARLFTSSSSPSSFPSNESMDDRIQRMRHESMMGVETYEREDGSEVEFSNRADRVFENNLDSLTHFGTEHYYDDYVPDGWTELNKKK